jgi:ketosteroid isomerase-like protein
MSRENVEVVHAAYDAWNRGDLQAVLHYLHPGLEWEENPDVYPGLDPVYRGHEGFLKRQRDGFDVWEWIRVEDQEFIDAGEHVVVFLHVMAKGRHSGIEVEMRLYDVFTLRDEKVIRHRLYADRAEALEAVGLSEQDAHAGS